jgi:hypothetical protein
MIPSEEERTMSLRNFEQEQIDDLAVMSREYERQEAARMASRARLDSKSKETTEPYINELIPVNHHAPRRHPGHHVRGRGR